MRAEHPLLNGSAGPVYGHQLLPDQYGHETVEGGHATVAMGAVLDIDVRDAAPAGTMCEEVPGENLVLWHNPTVGEPRATGSTAVVAETPYAQLKQEVQVRVPNHPEQFAQMQNLAGFVAEFPDDPVSIEAKTEEAARGLVEMIKANPELLNRVELFAFDGKFTRKMRKELGPEAVTGMAVLSQLAFYAFSKIPGLSRIAKYPTKSYVVAMPANLRQFDSSRFVKFLARHGRIGNAILDHTLIRPSTVRAAERSGLKLTAWTVNDEELAKELLQMGVPMIYTDDEKVAKAALAFADGLKTEG